MGGHKRPGGSVSTVGRVSHAIGAFCAVWTGARFVNSFFFHAAEYRSLHREARILLSGPCVTDAHAISGALIDCQNARRILDGRTFGVLYAAQHAARDVLVDTVRGASRELTFLLQLVLLLAACVFGLYMLLGRWAARQQEAQRRAWEEKAAATGYRFGNYAHTRWNGKATLTHYAPSDDESDDDDYAMNDSPRSGRVSQKMLLKLD